MTEPTPLEIYQARVAAADALAKPALGRNWNDTATWDARTREVQAALAELKAADPVTCARMLRSGMDAVSLRSTPAMPDVRTREEIAQDAVFQR